MAVGDLNKIIPYKKCCEIRDGKIVRMFWEHPSGTEEFDHEAVLARWHELKPGVDYMTAQALAHFGFKNENVIRDGVRPS